MKLSIFRIATALLCAWACAGIALAQADIAIRTSLTKPTPRVEAAQPLRTLENVLGSSLSAGFYASAGSTIVDGRPVGGFSALVNLPADLLFKGSVLSLGPEWRIERDRDDSSRYVSEWDALLQLVVKGSAQTSFAFTSSPTRGGFGIFFSRRF